MFPIGQVLEGSRIDDKLVKSIWISHHMGVLETFELYHLAAGVGQTYNDLACFDEL